MSPFKQLSGKQVEWVRCRACGGRGHQFASRPQYRCYMCKGSRVVLSLTPAGLSHLLRMLDGYATAESAKIKAELQRGAKQVKAEQKRGKA